MFKFISHLATSSWHYSSNLLLPPVCVGCASHITDHNLVCARCWRETHLITRPICERTGVVLPGATGSGPHFSAAALANPPVVDRTRAAAHYGGVIRLLITRFKFEDRHEPLPLFVKLMHDTGRELLADADVLVPVPLHRLRLLQRRFNQSAILAKRLGAEAKKPVLVTGLKRIRRTLPQVGLNPTERARNVEEAFSIHLRAAKLIANRNVLLIDDVVTTGATANACASVLKAAGAKRVDMLAIALVSPSLPHALFAQDAA